MVVRTVLASVVVLIVAVVVVSTISESSRCRLLGGRMSARQRVCICEGPFNCD